mmetsp:Transcript_46722/g.111230  ORF Transcript_46722/g.111230 Transcript_46722/m.111230 type:complete len:624 (-) Transcript_46722:643-2514(-)
MRTIIFSSLNSSRASDRAVSVFPTPDGPRNRKHPVGRSELPRPARERRTAFAMHATGLSCPTTMLLRRSTSVRTLSFSVWFSRDTGMPVERATTSAICSGPTVSTKRFISSPSRCACMTPSVCSRRGIVWYLSSTTLSRTLFSSRPWRPWCAGASSTTICSFASSTCFLISAMRRMRSFCSASFDRSVTSSSRAWAIAACTSCSLTLLSSSSSLASIMPSTSSRCSLRVRLSMISGEESSWTRTLAHASSMRSMALSGRNRPLMYRSDNSAAARRAESWIRTPWCSSYLALMPRSTEIVSSTVASPTYTCWKRRSKAVSFSTYLRYSPSVVVPMHRSSPRASIGFKRLAASMPPSEERPAPSTRWISSMKRMIFPSDSDTSLRTPLSRSSNSPWYLAPAISAPMSRLKMRQPRSTVGTSPATMRCARPSTIAVLPVPGSPMRTGLFLERRASTRTHLLISSLRPITGSSLPSMAFWTRSIPYCRSSSLSSSFAPSPFSLKMSPRARIDSTAFFIAMADEPARSRASETIWSWQTHTRSWSAAMSCSFAACACWRAEWSARRREGVGCILPSGASEAVPVVRCIAEESSWRMRVVSACAPLATWETIPARSERSERATCTGCSS